MFQWLLSFSKNTSTKQDSSDFPHLLMEVQCDILQGENLYYSMGVIEQRVAIVSY